MTNFGSSFVPFPNQYFPKQLTGRASDGVVKKLSTEYQCIPNETQALHKRSIFLVNYFLLAIEGD